MGRRDAAVAGVLGAALLGAAAAGAPVSGSAMGAGVAGFLFSIAACGFAQGSCRRLALETLVLLAGIAVLQVAGLAAGVAPSIWGSRPLLSRTYSCLLAGALLWAGLVVRDAPSLYPRLLRLGLAAVSGLLAALGAVEPVFLPLAGLAAGVYMLGEMAGWAGLARG